MFHLSTPYCAMLVCRVHQLKEGTWHLFPWIKRISVEVLILENLIYTWKPGKNCIDFLPVLLWWHYLKEGLAWKTTIWSNYNNINNNNNSKLLLSTYYVPVSKLGFLNLIILFLLLVVAVLCFIGSLAASLDSTH